MHRYLAEFDFRYNTRTALGYNDFMRAELAAKGIVGNASPIDGLTSKVRPKRIKRQAKRFLEWREKQRPKPVRARYWQSRKRSAGAKTAATLGVERTPMRTEDLFSGAVPMVVKLDIGMTEPEGVALEITYAQTRERFEARQFDRAMYVMTIPMANELLSILQTEMTGKGAQKH